MSFSLQKIIFHLAFSFLTWMLFSSQVSAENSTIKALNLKKQSIITEISSIKRSKIKLDSQWEGYKSTSYKLDLSTKFHQAAKKMLEGKMHKAMMDINKMCTNSDFIKTYKCTSDNDNANKISNLNAFIQEAFTEAVKSMEALSSIKKEREKLLQKKENIVSAKKDANQRLAQLNSQVTKIDQEIIGQKKKKTKLTNHARKQLRELIAIQSDMKRDEKIANIIIAAAPLRAFLDGFDIPDLYELGDSPEWEVMLPASKGLSSHYKDQLKLFCQAEALSSLNNSAEKRFWITMEKLFW